MSDIHVKLAKVAGQIGPINKDERNKEQGFNFRSIEAITAAARPLLAEHGISVAPHMVSLESSEVTAKSGARGFRAVAVMQYTFTAGSDDSSVTVSMPGEAVDYGDKSTSKAVQMAYKYALTQVLQIGSGDDPDGHTVEVGHSEPSRKGGRRQNPPKGPSTVATATGPLTLEEYAREATNQFQSWTPAERADSYKRHCKEVLDGKPANLDEVGKVVEVMVAEYYGRFPVQAPF